MSNSETEIQLRELKEMCIGQVIEITGPDGTDTLYALITDIERKATPDFRKGTSFCSGYNIITLHNNTELHVYKNLRDPAVQFKWIWAFFIHSYPRRYNSILPRSVVVRFKIIQKQTDQYVRIK